MGVPAFWPTVEYARKITTLTALAWFYLRNHKRPIRLAVDTSIIFFAIQSALYASRYNSQRGANPEFQNILHYLSFLLSLPISFIFVLDGTDRPKIKRDKKVKDAPHWMVQDFKDLVERFNQQWHQAPGEAEAEMAALEWRGLTDGSMTEDSDIFIRGGRFVVRFPHLPKDNDTVATYHVDDISSNAAIPMLTGHMLMFAVLTGCDANMKGLEGCGAKIAYSLHHSELPALFRFIAEESTSDNDEIAIGRMTEWLFKLADHLELNPYDFLDQKRPTLAKKLRNNLLGYAFRFLSAARTFTHASISNTSTTNIGNTWSLLRLPELTDIVACTEELFEWSGEEMVAKKLDSIIYPSFCLKYLAMLSYPDCADSVRGYELLEATAVTNVKLIKPKNIFYRVTMDISVLPLLAFPHLKSTEDKSVVIWVPQHAMGSCLRLLKSFYRILMDRRHQTPVTAKKRALVKHTLKCYGIIV